MNTCKKCGSQFDSSFCPNCGTKAEDDIKVEFSQPHFKEEKKNSHVILKFLGLIIIIIVLYNFVTPSDDNDSNSVNQNKEPQSESVSAKAAKYLTDEEISYLYSDPDKYKGKHVNLSGEVFVEPEKDSDGVYVQMYQDPTNNDKNTIIKCDPDIDVKSGDYIIVDGTIKGRLKGKNLMGVSLEAPFIIASSVKISSYQEVVVPTKKSIDINQKKKQYGYEIVLEKVEFAESETRLYVTINNNGSSKFTAWNPKIIQGKKQYEEQANYEAEYPEIQSDLHPKVSTSGIISFPAIDSKSGFQFNIEAHTDTFDEDIKDYVFEIKK